MPEFIVFMHADTTSGEVVGDWGSFLEKLQSINALRGGSAIGAGDCIRQDDQAASVSAHIVGYIKVEARDQTHACALMTDNPVYKAGGTIEIRTLPKTPA